MPSNHSFKLHSPTPFGSIMLGRDFSGKKYRFGFGGYEGDNEILGQGNSYTTEFRQYDPRLGRWKSIDPATQKFPGESPYHALLNNPNIYTDRNGDIPSPLLAQWKNKSGKIVTPWLFRGFSTIKNGDLKDHPAADFNMGNGDDDLGAPIVATHNGIVTDIKHFTDKDGGGNRVYIQSKDGTIQTRYLHMDAFAQNLYVGKPVLEGETIGFVGGSGNGDQKGVAVHLHYEIRLKKYGIFVPIDPYVNGELIDPEKDLEAEPGIDRIKQVDIIVKKGKQLPITQIINERDSTNSPKENFANDSTQNTNNIPDEK